MKKPNITRFWKHNMWGEYVLLYQYRSKTYTNEASARQAARSAEGYSKLSPLPDKPSPTAGPRLPKKE